MSETVEILFESLTDTNERDYWEVMGDAHTIFKPSAFTDLVHHIIGMRTPQSPR